MNAILDLELFSRSAFAGWALQGCRRTSHVGFLRPATQVVVVTGGLPVAPEIVELARKNDVSLLVSPHDSATTAMLSRASIAVKHMIHEHYLSFREDESLAQVEPMAAASNFQAFPVLDQNRRTVGAA